MPQYTLDSPVGKLTITIQDGKVIKVVFNEPSSHHGEGKDPSGDSRFRGNDEGKSENDGVTDRNDCIHTLNRELLAYFADPTHIFNIEHELTGTPFQKSVWEALKSIPVGQTLTYGELAKNLGSSPRAIGQACRNNPIPIIIPCHRVVGANNTGGFAGQTKGNLMAVKEFLLSHENKKRDSK